MKTRFLKSEHEVGEVYSYYFQMPDGFVWEAGQYLNYTLSGLSPSSSERLFTIASAPHEKILRVTTIAGSSDFKKKLRELKSGDKVEIDQLGGDFVWQDDGRQKLYLAGGIGVTPFRSIVLDRYHKKLKNESILMYAGRPDHRPFLADFEDVEASDDTFIKLDYPEIRITLEEISIVVPDYKDRTIYIAGPQPFVEGLGDALFEDDIPRAQIKYDWFDGYHHDL
ncbi:FAD-dependent oxidoreductase [Candidatus Nomurabacteria bacterium]|nr:FAD-dependent oxidoreductase [Candidatus Nomurabacteria bacterium]